jgi:hypothetical protein
MQAHEVWQALDGVDSAAFVWSPPTGTAQRATTLQRERFFPVFR